MIEMENAPRFEQHLREVGQLYMEGPFKYEGGPMHHVFRELDLIKPEPAPPNYPNDLGWLLSLNGEVIGWYIEERDMGALRTQLFLGNENAYRALVGGIQEKPSFRRQIAGFRDIKTVYLEYNPLTTQREDIYRLIPFP